MLKPALAFAAALSLIAAVPAQAQTAPKFNQWYLQLCMTRSGTPLNYVVAGLPNYCALTVKVTPNGAVPVKAVFTYELEWAQGGKLQKLALPGQDVWTPHGGGDIDIEVEDYEYSIYLPIHVRHRPDRQYTAINVIGNFTFSNGSTKKIFEKIDVVR
ncbi:hypothetical protein [Deinococcus radiophilus]|uniref:Uncharacterized protein n=1 Tax=Deinococcus radiophilus TaxID=32062 RepID=A0A431W1D7_9DEIO|nr:hypothetical protein [Deinococcus radiophilus]RTR29019.1 hypothetical protein EJ104_04020 [Deinococcus radiophilus]UFA49604.1 hypothetical protein LMT64_06770 [Deinococcus radiophilus]